MPLLQLSSQLNMQTLKKGIDIHLILNYNFASLILLARVELGYVSGRSSVWLEYLVWDQGAGGSSPLAPTMFLFCIISNRFFYVNGGISSVG